MTRVTSDIVVPSTPPVLFIQLSVSFFFIYSIVSSVYSQFCYCFLPVELHLYSVSLAVLLHTGAPTPKEGLGPMPSETPSSHAYPSIPEMPYEEECRSQ